MGTTVRCLAFLMLVSSIVRGQSDTIAFERHLLPLEEYVSISHAGGRTVSDAAPYSSQALHTIKIGFDRSKILPMHGPQFIKVTTSVYKRDGSLYNRTTQYAFTFPLQPSPKDDILLMRTISERIMTYNFTNRRKIDTIDVHLDSLPGWSVVEVNVTPDEEFTKYERRSLTRQTWFFRTTGNRFESSFFLGIPKVLYDSEKNDTITYGNASAMVRFSYLDGETGEPYPFNVGIGTFGVSTPIDVSSKGGGFAISVMFDVVRAFDRMYKWNITNKVNAGIEITPFFPINHRARILVNARIGISP
ncbi:MAG: hypothetical protein HYV29_00270 [Ignavibacteriales bacterium]|nr:hypothetical protein [Ignavibacteriales bacterium]